MRLTKNGLVRETDRPAEINRLAAIGYKPLEAGVPLSAEDQARAERIKDLMRLPVTDLRVMCADRDMTPPANVKKAELAEAVVAYDLAHADAEESEDG